MSARGATAHETKKALPPLKIPADQWQILSPLLDEALPLTPAARRAWLAQQTQLDAATRSQLAKLVALADAPESDHIFQSLTALGGAASPRAARASERQAGERVGPYELLRPLGRGGMAEVWLARRDDGAYEREVALKLPHTHLPHDVAARRMLRERNVLASLEHPAIARFYDAGVAADGQPFLAMEYVEGESITTHADRLKLDLRARSALVADVLDALHYAHQRLVVHRDLKPSNILVRADGRVALLDFGIAKVLESPSASVQATELTHVAGNALTLAYAAPEQLLAEPVTTSTDLYSVGVVLFELLTGGRPFAHAEQSASALIRAMDRSAVTTGAASTKSGEQRIDTNPDSSARARIQSNARGFASPAAWQRAFNGDLSAICAKALRNEPAERYASALSMREDLTRYLNHQPVRASSGAWAYRARKFFQRNTAAIIVSAAASVVAIALGAHAWQKTQDSQVDAARAAAVETVVKSLFSGMNPNSNTTRTFTAKELLDKSRPLMLQAGANDAQSRSKTHLMMGKLYLDVGALDEAIALLETEIIEARAAGDVRREVWAQCLLADAHLDQNKTKLAHDNMVRARTQLQPLVRQPELLSAEVDYRLGTAAYFLDNYTDADRYLKSAKRVLLDPSVKGETKIDTLANVLIKQATLVRAQGDWIAASDYFLEAQKVLQNVPGLQLTKDALAIEMLPVALAMGRFDDVIRQAEMLLSHLSTQPSANDAFWVTTTIHYIRALIRTGRLREASAQAKLLSANAVTRNDTARLKQAKRFETLIALHTGQSETALREYTAQLAPVDGETAGVVDPEGIQSIRRAISHSLLQLGRNAEALGILRGVEAAQTTLIKDAQSSDLAYTRVLFGVALIRQNELVEATTALTRAREALLAKRGANHWGVMLADAYLALIAAAQNPQAPPSATALNLADRVQRELGWQYGAPELAARLKRASPLSLFTVPALL
jgi:serine/threonine protein kinase